RLARLPAPDVRSRGGSPGAAAGRAPPREAVLRRRRDRAGLPPGLPRRLGAGRLDGPLRRRRGRPRRDVAHRERRRAPPRPPERPRAGRPLRRRRGARPARVARPGTMSVAGHLLSSTLLAPFAAALLLFALPERADRAIRLVSVLGAAVPLAASVLLLRRYDPASGGFQFVETYPLVPRLGLSWHLGVDGIAVPLVFLTAIIHGTAVFTSWTTAARAKDFYLFLALLVTGVYGVFASLDLFVFFLFYELAVLPMYVLIGVWGSSGEARPRGIFAWAYRSPGVGGQEYAGIEVTLVLLFGSALILVGVFALYVAAGSSSFSFLDLEAASFDPLTQRWVFLAFYVGFGILAGIWPLHTWSPDGHAAAPTAVSMLHAGVLMKLGAYGVV